MTNLILFLSPYLIGSACGWLYRWVRFKLGKPSLLRPLYKWEKQGRRFWVLVMFAIVLGQELLATQGLALRPNLNDHISTIFLFSGMIWLSLVLVRRAKNWDWGLYLGTVIALLPFTFFIWFLVYLSGNGLEYDIVTENGKTYLHTSEQESWSDHYVHKYEVVNDYLMKARAADYDIHRLSERHYNFSYEEKYFSKEDTND